MYRILLGAFLALAFAAASEAAPTCLTTTDTLEPGMPTELCVDTITFDGRSAQVRGGNLGRSNDYYYFEKIAQREDGSITIHLNPNYNPPLLYYKAKPNGQWCGPGGNEEAFIVLPHLEVNLPRIDTPIDPSKHLVVKLNYFFQNCYMGISLLKTFVFKPKTQR